MRVFKGVKKAFSLVEMLVVLLVTSLTISGTCLYMYFVSDSMADTVNEDTFITESVEVKNAFFAIMQEYDAGEYFFNVKSDSIQFQNRKTGNKYEITSTSIKEYFNNLNYTTFKGISFSVGKLSQKTMIQANISYVSNSVNVIHEIYIVKSATVIILGE